MTERTYSSDEYRILADLCEHEWASIAAAKTAPAKLAAALRIAARVMEPGVLEKAIRACVLGPENAELHPPMEYERNSANTIRSFLTKDTP